MGDQETGKRDVIINVPNRMNSAAWALTQANGGERVDLKTPRGLYTKKPKKGELAIDPATVEQEWLAMIEAMLGYQFQHAQILEEALESEGSGVVGVGEGRSKRDCARGNRGLARLGEAVLRAAQEDIGFRARLEGDDIYSKTKKLLTEANLVKVGKRVKLDRLVRPPMPLSEKQNKKLFSKVTKKVNKDKLLADALKGVIAAVFMDSGYEAVKWVLEGLQLYIKPGN